MGVTVLKLRVKRCGVCFSVAEKRGGVCPVCGCSGGEALEPDILPRGTKLSGRYVIGGCIGRGGFGITYLAYDKKLNKTIAIKEFFPTMAARRSGRHIIPNSEKNAEQFNIGAEKFFDEAEIVRRFNGNPNIVSIYECFYENNTAYYAMEYLDGITLQKYVKEYGPLNCGQAAYVADRLTMAMVVLHSAKVLHRDISPDNVMICRDGNVKLIDFGAARQFLSDGSLGYTVIMKTGFSPMEQYSQETGLDVRADIYSVGTLLYYALTGNVPESPYKRLKDDSVFHLNSANADDGLRAVIEKAAAIMPSERYDSAEDFRSALSELDIEMTAVSVPDEYNSFSNGRAPSSASSKKRSIFAAAAVICAAAAVMLVLFAIRGRSHLPDSGKIELALDNEYAGHFTPCAEIPASELKKVGGDVEITLSVKPWENMDPATICGFIPVNSDDAVMIEYLSAADELWADANGWISVDSGVETVTLVLSREGAESLGNGSLGFETYNLIITSAELKRAEKKRDIGIDDWYELRNAAYSVSENENGKTVIVPLSEDRIQSWPDYETQAIPKSAFFEFDGDVKVTLGIEALEGAEFEQRIVYVQNSGYCFGVMNNKYLVPAAKDSAGNPLVKRDHFYGMMLGKGCSELTIVIPKNAKDKISSGVFFQSMGVKVTRARLENYNGEYGEFV